MGTNVLDVLETHPMTGKNTRLAKTIGLAIRAMSRAKVPYCAVGAAAADPEKATEKEAAE